MQSKDDEYFCYIILFGARRILLGPMRILLGPIVVSQQKGPTYTTLPRRARAVLSSSIMIHHTNSYLARARETGNARPTSRAFSVFLARARARNKSIQHGNEKHRRITPGFSVPACRLFLLYNSVWGTSYTFGPYMYPFGPYCCCGTRQGRNAFIYS